MGMTTEELGKNLKAGKIMAKDMVPKLAKALRELAAPGLAKSLKTLESTENRLLNTWRSFKDLIFTSGLGDFLGGLYTTFGNLLILMKPLANILGGVTKGIQDVLYPVEYAIALFLDWAEAMGYLDSTTQNWSKSAQKEFEDFGQVIGWVLGVWGVSKIYLMIKELWKMIGVINRARTAMLALATTQAATSFVGPMPQGTPPTGTPSTGSVGGGLTGLLGLGFAWDKFTKSDLYTGREATPLAKGETDITKQFAAMPTIWDSINELKKIATSTTPINNQYYNPYQGTTGVPQTVPITLDIKVTGDAMSQHFTKELGNNTTAQ